MKQNFIVDSGKVDAYTSGSERVNKYILSDWHSFIQMPMSTIMAAVSPSCPKQTSTNLVCEPGVAVNVVDLLHRTISSSCVVVAEWDDDAAAAAADVAGWRPNVDDKESVVGWRQALQRVRSISTEPLCFPITSWIRKTRVWKERRFNFREKRPTYLHNKTYI